MQKALCFIAALLLMACSSEENVMDEAHKVDVGKGITFQFNEEAFVPGTIIKKGTRAVQTPEVIDLGNGLTAEVALEPDTLGLSQTRAANPIPDGHYKIYAIDASNVRHDGIDGNVSGGVFTANPPGRWELNSGETYTFVCINDAVVDNGTSLSYTYSHNQTVLQPLIGVTQHQVSNMGDDVVSFVMRHQNARVRFQITSYTAPCVGAKINFITDATIAPCGVTNYNLKGTITGYLNSIAVQTSDFTPLTADKPHTTSSVTETYKTSTDYLYYPGHFQMWMAHYVRWEGTVYGKHDIFDDNKMTHIFFSHQATDFLERNHSYVYNITIRPSVLYLFSDGTVGTIGDKGSRTPIAVVVKEKTSASDKGLACALKNAGGTGIIPWGYRGTNYFIAGGDGSFDNMKGYEYTYTTDYYNPAAFTEYGLPMATTPPAEQQSLLPTYYYAAHYNPGVPVTGANIGKWFLPSAGQVKLLLKRYADLKETDMPTDFYDFWSPPTPIPGAPINTTKLEKVFTDGGATWVNLGWALSGTDTNNHSISVSMWGGKATWDYESGNLPYMHQQSVYSFVYF